MKLHAINMWGFGSIWHSGKPVSQFTTQEKIDLEIAAKKLDQFDRSIDQSTNSITNELLGK
jgi:hypothetical protein